MFRKKYPNTIVGAPDAQQWVKFYNRTSESISKCNNLKDLQKYQLSIDFLHENFSYKYYFDVEKLQAYYNSVLEDFTIIVDYLPTESSILPRQN